MNRNSLPPGLLSRAGKLVEANQRLPSLKNSANVTVQSFLNVNGSNSLTKGGAVKRQFKPKIPAPRTSGSPASTSGANDVISSKEKPKRDSAKDSKRKANVKKKEYIQLEGTVFTGANAPLASSRSFSQNSIGSVRYSSPKVAVDRKDYKLKQQSEQQSNTEASFLRDDFIEYSDDDEDDIPPKGWTSLSCAKNEKPKDTFNFVNPACVNFHNLLKSSKPEDNLTLIQLPTVLTRRPEGKIGKLRFYKSGKVQIIEEPSGLVFDVLRSNSYCESALVKQEDPTLKNETEKRQHQKTHQQIVSFNGNNIISLGELNQDNVLVGVPVITDQLNTFFKEI